MHHLSSDQERFRLPLGYGSKYQKVGYQRWLCYVFVRFSTVLGVVHETRN